MTRPRRTAPTILVAVAVALGAGCTSYEGEYEPTSMPLPPEVDIPYGPERGCNSSPRSDNGCGGSQELDIYRSRVADPNPVAVWIHGGGFVGGDKSDGVEEHFDVLLEDGWDIVAINYRLSTEDGEHRWPVPLQDVFRAVRWIKANAGDQGWDADRVAAFGHSAGGNLAGMLATASDVERLQPTDLPSSLQEVDSGVVAAAGLRPVSDVAAYSESLYGDTVDTYLGCSDGCPDVMADASVHTHVDGDAAPYLAIHGVDDGLAGPEQGRRARDAYEAAGVDDRFRLIVVDDGPQKFQGHQPDPRRFAEDVLEHFQDAAGDTFLDRIDLF